MAVGAKGQQAPQTQVKPNDRSVCTPSTEERTVISSALAAVSDKPVFAEDFEIARGVVTLRDAPASRFVRLRREFNSQSSLLTVQYSMSTDENATIELLVFRLRDPKEFHEVLMEDRVSAGSASPLSVVARDTPVTRIRIERLGKNSVSLSRCTESDQSSYEEIFKRASEIMAQYRAALGLRTTFRSDIVWLSGANKSAPSR
jgi:hypothetical protein